LHTIGHNDTEIERTWHRNKI